MTDRPTAPAYLLTSSKRFFDEIVDGYDLEPHHIRILTLACQSLDRAAEARAEIKKSGAYFTDRFNVRKPVEAIKVERSAQLAFARLLRELGLDIEQVEAHRTPSKQQNGLARSKTNV